MVKGTDLLNLGGEIMALGIVGLSLVLLTGYSGQVSLCQFSFMGIGAFLMGKIAGGGSLLGLLAAALICAALGALVALPTLRLRRPKRAPTPTPSTRGSSRIPGCSEPASTWGESSCPGCRSVVTGRSSCC